LLYPYAGMSSQRRILASRANGARSKGPVTPEGKGRSSRNATKHGLLSDLVVLETESSEGFAALSAVFVQRFQPADDVENGLVEELAAATWRIRRAWTIERCAIERKVRLSGAAPLDAMTDLFTNPESSQSLDLMQRYETRLQRMYQRALRGLLLLRRERNERPVGISVASGEAPAAPPVSAPPLSGHHTGIPADAPTSPPVDLRPPETEAAPCFPGTPIVPETHSPASVLPLSCLPSFRTSPARQQELLREISNRS
jgi:hypothetical protein